MAARHALGVADPEAVAAVFDRLASGQGPAGVLVNNAGVAAVHPFLEHPLEAWNRVMAVNLTGAFLCGHPSQTENQLECQPRYSASGFCIEGGAATLLDGVPR